MDLRFDTNREVRSPEEVGHYYLQLAEGSWVAPLTSTCNVLSDAGQLAFMMFRSDYGGLGTRKG